jgi:hypothetical protein
MPKPMKRAHFCQPITVEQVLVCGSSLSPLKLLLDCCPEFRWRLRLRGGCRATGAHLPPGRSQSGINNAQHISAQWAVTRLHCGALASHRRPLAASGRTLADVEAAAIYDSFIPITLNL